MTAVQDVATTITIRSTSCGDCGIMFGLTAAFVKARRDDHATFYCPNGHLIGWSGPTEADKLRKQLKNAQALTAFERERKEEWRRSAAAAKGQVTKLKNRISNGVCPCCNRTFQNLSRHMAGQHPDFVD